jgi:hypothetical protein
MAGFAPLLMHADDFAALGTAGEFVAADLFLVRSHYHESAPSGYVSDSFATGAKAVI